MYTFSINQQITNDAVKDCIKELGDNWPSYSGHRAETTPVTIMWANILLLAGQTIVINI